MNPTNISQASRWFLVSCTGLIMFGNHYARDAVGALENQIEKDLMISVHDYASINAFYFLPSILSPILAGMFTIQLGGPANCLLYSVFCGSIGHIIFSLGIQTDNRSLMLFGRSIAGFMYEIIDSMPFVILAPMFTSGWGLIMGLLNGFLRLGSVMNFVVSPIMYKRNGVKMALWLATFVFSLSIFFAIAIKIVLYKENGSNDYKEVYLQATMDQDDSTSSPEEIDIEQRNNHNENTFSFDSLSDKVALTISSTDIDDVSIIGTGKNNYSKLSSTGTNNNPNFKENMMKNFFETANLFKTYIWESLASVLPLNQFSSQYYMFLLSGAFLYGSMVPFWFLGSKFLQDNYMLSVRNADLLMLLPEGFIAIVAVPLGLMLDAFKCTTKKRLLMLTAACLLLPLSYMMLAFGFYVDNSISKNVGNLGAPEYIDIQSNRKTLIPPSFTMCAVGLAYSISNCLYWSTVIYIFPEGKYLAAANGLLAGSMNILPSVVSPFLVFISSFNNTESNIILLFPLYLLSGLGICSSIFAFIASLHVNPLTPLEVESMCTAIELQRIENEAFEK